MAFRWMSSCLGACKPRANADGGLMEPRISFVTLGVSDLQLATGFYADGLGLPRLKSPPNTSFFDLGGTRLALYPRELLAADAGVPATGSGFPGFALAHNVRSAAEADRLLQEVVAAGGRIVKPAAPAEWGGSSGYLAAPTDFSGRWRETLVSPFPNEAGCQPFPKRKNARRMERDRECLMAPATDI